MSIFRLATTVVAAVILLLFSRNSHAESKTSAQYQKCLDDVDFGALKNSQWASCAEQEIERQDIVLNSEYRKLQKSLSTEQNRALTKAQSSWLQFREGWCRFVEISPEAPGGINNYYFCIIDLTNRQIDEIKGYQELAGG